MPQITNVSSSWIAGLGFDLNPGETEEHGRGAMVVTFTRGGSHTYFNVPLKTYIAVLEASSIGKAWHALIRNKY